MDTSAFKLCQGPRKPHKRTIFEEDFCGRFTERAVEFRMFASIEVSDLLSYLVLETSHEMNKQFKALKSLQAYNQMISGFVASVNGKEISDKFVVVAKVRHSQSMRDPLVNIWIIAEKGGTIISALCLNCKAGLRETCSHVVSALFYIKAITLLQ